MVDDQILRQLRQALRQASSAVTVHNPEEAPVMGRPEGQPVDGPDGWHLFLPQLGCELRCADTAAGAPEQLRLAAVLAEALLRHGREPQERLRRQLEGDLAPDLTPADRRVLALQPLDGTPASSLREILPLQERDILVDIQPDLAALIKDVSEMRDNEAFAEYTQALRDTLLSEAGCELAVGVSGSFREAEALPEAWRQARQVLSLGRRLHPEARLFHWDRMVVERLLAELTPEQTAAYRGILFNRKTARFFNEETLRTIETFLDADLNLSDTARQLYIHRNTLVYRLDKLQQLTGLDLRKFDDAMTFRILLYLHAGSPAQAENDNRRIKK